MRISVSFLCYSYSLRCPLEVLFGHSIEILFAETLTLTLTLTLTTNPNPNLRHHRHLGFSEGFLVLWYHQFECVAVADLCYQHIIGLEFTEKWTVVIPLDLSAEAVRISTKTIAFHLVY
uniref:Uncharacterized protein n=1 Tax=Ananas comosus var. bracteatus TaxID=296719 RepID=A0A6V7QUY1_ANACO